MPIELTVNDPICLHCSGLLSKIRLLSHLVRPVKPPGTSIPSDKDCSVMQPWLVMHSEAHNLHLCPGLNGLSRSVPESSFSQLCSIFRGRQGTSFGGLRFLHRFEQCFMTRLQRCNSYDIEQSAGCGVPSLSPLFRRFVKCLQLLLKSKP